ncbi:HK97 family phage prohead protease [Streptomyces sp. 4N124]|uniref:HK97 family phage prohead protease n=1 Tax=Streptomyces sp. 4N124 TaxID=3457420 RepID=UPI003FD201AF
METRQFELRTETSGDGRTLIAVAVPYGSPTTVTEGGRTFKETVTEGACRSAVNSGGIPVLWAHQRESVPVAVTTGLEERADGLHLRARFLTHDLAEASREAVAEGCVGSSIGFTVPEGGDVWNRDQTERTIHQLELKEVSLTPWPAYSGATAAVRSASGGGITAAERRRVLADLAWRGMMAPGGADGDAVPAEPPSAEQAMAALKLLAAFVKSYESGWTSGMPPPT